MTETGAEHWTTLLPELALVGGAVLLLLLNIFSPARRGAHFPVLTFVAIAVAGWLAARQWGEEELVALGGMVVQDRFGVFARLVILAGAALATLGAHDYLKARGLDRAEFYSLMLLATAGMTLLTVSADLIMVFLSVELFSLALYIMVGFERRRADSQEASMKYFLIGAFASAFLIYGIAFVFGATGTTSLVRMSDILAAAAVDDLRLLSVAVALLAVGLAFKASMVPFHMWTPDAYQGAPTPVTVFMSAATKAAAFAVLLRIFVGSLSQLVWEWQPILAALAAVTILFASVLAVAQTDVKRILAYSAVAHAGFLAMAVAAAGPTGVAAALLYLLVYTAMTVGAFGSVMLFREGAAERVHLSKYSGLGVRRPLAAAVFALFLFSLAGVPPTGGFWAKWYVFLATVEAGLTWLVVLAVAASVVAAFFYARIAVVMFMQEPSAADEMPLTRSVGLRVSLALSAAVVVAVMVAPGFFLSLAERAATFAGG